MKWIQGVSSCVTSWRLWPIGQRKLCAMRQRLSSISERWTPCGLPTSFAYDGCIGIRQDSFCWWCLATGTPFLLGRGASFPLPIGGSRSAFGGRNTSERGVSRATTAGSAFRCHDARRTVSNASTICGFAGSVREFHFCGHTNREAGSGPVASGCARFGLDSRWAASCTGKAKSHLTDGEHAAGAERG